MPDPVSDPYHRRAVLIFYFRMDRICNCSNPAIRPFWGTFGRRYGRSRVSKDRRNKTDRVDLPNRQTDRCETFAVHLEAAWGSPESRHPRSSPRCRSARSGSQPQRPPLSARRHPRRSVSSATSWRSARARRSLDHRPYAPPPAVAAGSGAPDDPNAVAAVWIVSWQRG
jgi:hypothetical protein